MEAPPSLSGHRHVLTGNLARGLCLGGLILALLGPAAAPAGAVAGPGVVITGPGEAQSFVPESTIRAGTPLEGTPYLQRATPTEAGEPTSRRGMPVRQVIEASGVPFDAGGYLTISRPKGTVAYLENEDFEEPSPAFEEGKPALFYVDEGSTHFFRPLFAADPDDVNVEDSIATVSGEALTIGLHEGNVLSVGASSSPSSTQAGQAVQFGASASGGEPDERISYRWSFGDGSSGEGSSVSHIFSGSGAYEVRVTAIGSDGSGGESGPVEVVVGSPPTTAQPGAAPEGTKPKPKPKPKPSGPSGKGAQGRGGKGSEPQSGGGSRGGSGDGGGRSLEEGSTGSSPAETRGAAAPAPIEPEATAPSETEPPSPSEPSRPAPPAKESSAAPPLGNAKTVEGLLVADDLGAAAPTAGSSSSSGSESDPGAVERGSGASVPLAALIVLGLLAAGVLLEWRGARPRLR